LAELIWSIHHQYLNETGQTKHPNDFPEDFMFQLTKKAKEWLIENWYWCQFGNLQFSTDKIAVCFYRTWYRTMLSFYTEQVAQQCQVNIKLVMRIFIKMRSIPQGFGRNYIANANKWINKPRATQRASNY
jgi:hypothetical protein